MPTIDQALRGAGLPISEARLLLQAVLSVDRLWLAVNGARLLAPSASARFAALVERRRLGEPVAYLIGEREFFSLTFRTTPDVLIPRPETELLVEQALEKIAPDAPCRVLDLGTGSGAIAISIAQARPRAHVVGIDSSAAALAVAQGNARHLLGAAAAARLAWRESDWFSALERERFDVIVANPPYVAAGDHHLQTGDVRFEPRAALIGGADGWASIRAIVALAPDHLISNGWLMLEHGYDQAAECRELLLRRGFQEVRSQRDLGNIERVSSGCWRHDVVTTSVWH